MRSALDAEIDAAVARLTGPDGMFQMAQVERRGQMMPFIASAPANLPQFFAHFCALYGDRPFLVDGSERLSFAQTYAAARRVAGGLVAGYGVKPGDHIGLAARNGNGWIIAYMGIVMAGGVATLLNGFWTGDELAEAIADVGCTLVLADGRRHTLIGDSTKEHGAELVHIQLRLPVDQGLSILNVRGGDQNTPLPDIAPEDDATILFTSGSTGKSKGAVSDHMAVVQGALNFAGATICMLDITTRRGDPPTHLPATLLNVPLFHVTAEISVLLHSFVIGRKLVLMAKWDAREAMRLIEQEQITYFIGVPLMSYEIVTHPDRAQFDLSTLKDMASGGAPRPVEHVRRLASDMPKTNPVIGYGLTETNAVGCGNFRENYLAKPGSTGMATPPLVDMAILDDAGQRVPDGSIGEVCFRSVANFKYYWNRQEETRAIFTDDAYLRTGDLGYVDSEGYLFIVDRKKDIIIRGGENISSPEVESVLYEHPAVRECAVFGLPDARYGEVPAAVVHLQEGHVLDSDTLTAFLKTRLAPFKVPCRIWFSPTPLPRLGTEKVDKRALKEMHKAMV